MGLGHKFKNIRYGPSPSNFNLLYHKYNMAERERERERKRGGGEHEA